MPVIDDGDSMQVLKALSSIYLLTYLLISQTMKKKNEESL